MIWTRDELLLLLEKAKTLAPASITNGKWPDPSFFAEIAFLESGGQTFAHGHNANGTVDRGLWQINSVHEGEFPEIEALAPGKDFRVACYMPLYNAMLAVVIWQKQGYKAWSTYNTLIATLP